jgi:hypothetical protein
MEKSEWRKMVLNPGWLDSEQQKNCVLELPPGYYLDEDYRYHVNADINTGAYTGRNLGLRHQRHLSHPDNRSLALSTDPGLQS